MLVDALKDIKNDCLASDFNEHWDSYRRACKALSASAPEVAKYLAEVRAKVLEDAVNKFADKDNWVLKHLRQMANELRAIASQPTIKEE